MKNYSVKEKGEKGYLIENTPTGDVVDMVWPLPSEGGGGGIQPGPNTVGTDEIIDGSIELVDVDPNAFAKNSDIDEIFND